MRERVPATPPRRELPQHDPCGVDVRRSADVAAEHLLRRRVSWRHQGVAVAENQSSLKAGLRGPALLADFILREKITHFDHERIPERIVHARGSAAHGVFELHTSLERYTTAKVLTHCSAKT